MHYLLPFLLLVSSSASAQWWMAFPPDMQENYITGKGPVISLPHNSLYVRTEYSRLYNTPGLSYKHITMAKGIDGFTPSFSLEAKGAEFYKWYNFSTAVSHRINHSIFGGNLNWNYRNVENFSGKHLLTGGLAGLFRLNENLFYSMEMEGFRLVGSRTADILAGPGFSSILTARMEGYSVSLAYRKWLHSAYSIAFHLDFMLVKNINFLLSGDPLNNIWGITCKVGADHWKLNYRWFRQTEFYNSDLWTAEVYF